MAYFVLSFYSFNTFLKSTLALPRLILIYECTKTQEKYIQKNFLNRIMALLYQGV